METNKSGEHTKGELNYMDFVAKYDLTIGTVFSKQKYAGYLLGRAELKEQNAKILDTLKLILQDIKTISGVDETEKETINGVIYIIESTIKSAKEE